MSERSLRPLSRVITAAITCLLLGGCLPYNPELARLGEAMEGAGAAMQGPSRVHALEPVPSVVPQTTVYNCQRWRNGDVSCTQR
jgi:hypothetical protein